MSGSPGVIKRGGNCSGTSAEMEKTKKSNTRWLGEVEAVFRHGEVGWYRKSFNGCYLSLQRNLCGGCPS